MKRLTAVLIALVTGAAWSSAGHAATTANLSVTGTIKPVTCAITIGGVADATFAYGKISPTRLNQGVRTPLEVKSLPLRIVCDGATKLAVTAQDNKSGTNPFTTGTVDSSDAGERAAQPAAALYGLGTYGPEKKNIGGFSLALNATTAKLDSKPAYLLYGYTNGRWYSNALSGGIGGPTNTMQTWSTTSGSTIPVQATTFDVDLMVKPWILPRADLDLTDTIALDGSATVEIKYL